MLPADLFSVAKPIIGMLHAPALPGSPGARFTQRLAIRDAVLLDAAALVEGGVHALMLENFGDAPFGSGRVPAETVAAMTWLAGEIRNKFDVPLGINVLRNDGRSALAIAAAVGARFLRVNILTGARVTDQGLIEGIAHDLLRDRDRLGADMAIFADVDVKHSAPLVRRPVAEEVPELLERGGADALIVTGTATGAPADPALLAEVRSLAQPHPVFVGSGVTAENVHAFRDADGFIIGTAFKREGRVAEPVDAERVREFARALLNESTSRSG